MTHKIIPPSAATHNGYGLRVTLIVALTVLGALALFASQAFATKEAANYFGTTDSNGNTNIGGELSNASDDAVNSTGIGPANAGDVYVTDTSNNRVQRFDAEGNFVSAWGADVVKSGGAGDVGNAAAKDYEICIVAADCQAAVAAGGNGSPTGNGSLSKPQAIAVDPDTGNVYVSDAGNNRVNEYTGAGAFIRSFGWDVVKSGDPGDVSGTNEVQTVSLDSGVDGEFMLDFGGIQTPPIAAGAAAAVVQSALEGLATIDPGDVSASGPQGGPWTVTFTGDLAERDVPQLSVDGEPGFGYDGSQFSNSKGLSSPVGTELTCASTDVATTTNYQWLTNGAPSTGPGAHTNAYTTVAADAGKTVQCQVFKLNANGGSTQISWPAVTVSPYTSEAPRKSSEVGSPQPFEPTAGTKMQCAPEGWGGVSNTFAIGYQWYRNGAPIAGASGTGREGSYTLHSGDVPGVIQCLFTGTENGLTVVRASGNQETSPGIGSPPPPGGVGGTPTVTVSGLASGSVVTDIAGANGGMEVCEGAAGCHRGSPGTGIGQIGSESASGALGIAIASDGNPGSGTLYLADSANRRVDVYGLDGSSPASFGSAAQFGADQPRRLAVDSAGIVYASNSNNGGEIERYDSGSSAFLEPITAADSSPSAGPLLAGSADSATSGLAVDPDNDVLYVLRDPSSGSTVVQQFGPVNTPGQIAPPSVVDDTHGAGADFGATSGLGLDDVSGRLYLDATVAQVRGERLYVLKNAVAPTATLDPITSFDAHSATFSGHVNPNGFRTAYRFEYVNDTEFAAHGFTNAAQVPVSDPDLGAGTTTIDLTQKTPHHLVPGTIYHVRLVAKQILTPTTTIAGPLTFTTPDSAPSFHAVASGIGTDAATLRAAIDPENKAVTDYHFQWGAGTGYGNTTPAGTLPAGSNPVAVSASLSSLVPGQTYHYRLIATNGTGTTTGPDQTFATFASQPQLGPKRGYEVVSWLPTGGVPFSVGGGIRVRAAEDGDSVEYLSAQPVPGSETPMPADQVGGGVYWTYESVRGEDGWQVHQLGLGEGGALSLARAANARRDLFTTTVGLDPDDQNHSQDVYLREPGGSFVWVSRDPRIPPGTPQTTGGWTGLAKTFGTPGTAFPEMATMSADGRIVLFSSERQLLNTDTSPASAVRLYKWSEGQLSLVGVRPDGSMPAGGSAVSALTLHTMSLDGHRVVWNADRSGGGRETLYVQRDGQPAMEAVKETGVAPLAPPQPYDVAYRGAATDDSRVLFTSASRLTPDAGAEAKQGGDQDLYLYDLVANKTRDLTPRLDGIEDPSVEAAKADRARVLGVAANSDDGKVVYFVADARYPTAPNPEGELPSPNGHNLYMAELDGVDEPIELRFVAALGEGDGGVWQPIWGQSKAAYASPDGAVLGFGSSEDLVAGKATGGTEQLYVYDATTNTLDCASCPADGSLPAGDVNHANVGPEIEIAPWQHTRDVKRWISENGTVFFDTPTPLVGADQNEADDVYEYRAGQLRLISAGTSNYASVLANASLDGSTVFFATTSALAPQDDEPGVFKLYAARVGGGFPHAPPLPSCDLGAGACEGAGTSAPQQPGAGSAAFSGPGNPRSKPRKRHHRKKRHHHTRKAKHDRRTGR